MAPIAAGVAIRRGGIAAIPRGGLAAGVAIPGPARWVAPIAAGVAIPRGGIAAIPRGGLAAAPVASAASATPRQFSHTSRREVHLHHNERRPHRSRSRKRGGPVERARSAKK